MSKEKQAQQKENKGQRPSPTPQTPVAKLTPAQTSLQNPAQLERLPNHPTSHPIRRATILRMQQRQGNAAVQRYLQQVTSRPTSTLIQRRKIGMRQIRGMGQVIDLGKTINKAGQEFKVAPEIIGVIIMHESQAAERAQLSFEWLANAAERLQAKIQGDSASIGIGQMQVGKAKKLRQKYPQLVGSGVVDDLLNKKRAARYVAAQLSEIQTQLDAFLAAQKATLTDDAKNDMLALGYNIGWVKLRDRNLKDRNFGADIPARVATIRNRSNYLKKTTAFVDLIRTFLAKTK
ncbi:MAG: hypothetical protein GY796_03515 [Chloroflexi bacterium]|nr:hypothetical protein [Chloroflexota bacterium]